MKLLWTRHAERQLARRTSLFADQVLLYFEEGAAVLTRVERNRTREFVIFSAPDRDHYIVILARDNQVLTIMPLKWRPIAPAFLDEARRLYAEKVEPMQ